MGWVAGCSASCRLEQLRCLQVPQILPAGLWICLHRCHITAGLLGRHPQSVASELALHYVGPSDIPAAAVSLRAIDPERYSIVNEDQNGETIEEIEESKAFYEVYDGAVYMFQVG